MRSRETIITGTLLVASLDVLLALSKYGRPFILLVILYVTLSTVNAQTVNITDVKFPSSVFAGSLEPIVVSAVIPYHDAGAGYWLLVGIVDPQLNFTLVQGIADGSPNLCVNPLGSAYCRVQIQAGSGVENLQFRIGGIFAGARRVSGSWNLQITAVLLDSNGTILTRLDNPFVINFAPASLTINAPSNVTVMVDGIAGSSGRIPIALGRHSISVPMFVSINQTTRLLFDHWSDGVTEPNRTISILSSTELSAIYLTQYRLVLSSNIAGLDLSGAGWYDGGSVAHFAVAVVQVPTAGILGLFGARVTFQGWSENGRLITSSTSGSVQMTRAHVLQAEWKIDYMMPLVIFALLGIGLGLAIYLVKRPRLRMREKRLKAGKRRTVARRRK